MKRLIATVMCLVLMFSCTAYAMQNDETAFTPGTYTGTARGMYSDVTVEVTVDESSILSVAVTQQNDTRRIAAAAVDQLPERIISSQSLTVDTVTGATMTSYGILYASKAALAQAGVDMPVGKPSEEDKATLPDENYDVVIIGAGGAGLAAAVEIGRSSDASVLVLEKAGYTGGSTALSGGMLVAGGSRLNGVSGDTGTDDVLRAGSDTTLDYTPEEYLEYFKSETAKLSRRPDDMWINEDLVLRIGATSGKTINYYLDEGIDLSTTSISAQWSETGGLSGFAGKEVGTECAASVWGDWYTALAEKNGAEIRVNSEATALINDGNKVAGVVVDSPDGIYTVYAKKIVLACGGYGNNIKMLAEKDSSVPNIDTILSYTVPTDTGDFYALTEPFNAAEAGYGHINVLSAGPGLGFHTPEGLMALIGFNVWVNKDAQRFANEKEYPPYHVSFSIFDQPDGIAYGIAGSDLPFAGGDAVALFESMVEKGIAYKGDTIEQLAQQLELDPDALTKTIDDYNASCLTGNDDPLFGQSAAVMAPVAKGPFYAMRIYTCVLGTIGGLKANENCQIIDKDGEVISNLYGAGEVIFGNIYLQEYYCSGTGVGNAVYTGVIAGEEVVKSLN